jgi:hypothetical protein
MTKFVKNRKPDLCNPTLIGLSMPLLYQNGNLCQTNSTPDFAIDGVFWELKSPTGRGKQNIQHQLNNAIKQSENIILDARRSKIDIRKIRHQLNYFAKKAKSSKNIKKVLLINKESKIEVIK